MLAIEPNEAMRQAAFSHPLVEYRDATAEATGLPDASVDLVTCFESFHWFDVETTLLEFHRILKSKGRLALIWSFGDNPIELYYSLLNQNPKQVQQVKSRTDNCTKRVKSSYLSDERVFA